MADELREENERPDVLAEGVSSAAAVAAERDVAEAEAARVRAGEEARGRGEERCKGERGG